MNIKRAVFGGIILLAIAVGVGFAARTAVRGKGSAVSLPKAQAPSTLIADADALIAQGKTTEAAQVLQGILQSPSASPDAGEAQKRLDAMGFKLYFDSLNESNAIVYSVKPGDNLTKIARAHKVTVGTIKIGNSLASDALRPGQKLKIMTEPWGVLVDKSRNVLLLKAGEKVVKTYPVATGKDRSTPVGEFKITNHVPNPTWYYDGKAVPPGHPDNPLGTHWMGFDKPGYGIHGTTDPDSIGQYATLGCVRLENSQVAELYDLLPDGTMVKIID